MDTTLLDCFEIGDVITINGLYADGTREKNETPPSEYQNKPLQKWRVVIVEPHGVKIRPLNADGTLGNFNDAFGDYWIR